MANLCSYLKTSHDDAKPWLRIVWAVATGVLTAAILNAGGILALQYATVIMGLPFAFVMILVVVGLWRALRVEGNRAHSGDHALPMMLSARDGTSDEGSTSAPKRSWSARLAHALTFPDTDKGSAFLDETVAPALRDVADELGSQGVDASVTLDVVADADADASATSRNVHLQTIGEGAHPFVYRVELRQAPVPEYGGRMVRGDDTYARLEVHSAEGGQGYDVMGYTQNQIIHDCLDAYIRHLEFLRLEDTTDGR